MDYKKMARLFKALGDENRLRILELLKGGEKCACVLLEDIQISQPTLSHHMKILCDADIVVSSKEGKWVYYSIVPNVKDNIIEALESSLFACSGEKGISCKNEIALH